MRGQVAPEALLEDHAGIRVANHAVQEDEGADGQRNDAQGLAQLRQLLLQGGRLVLVGLKHFGDHADLGRHAR